MSGITRAEAFERGASDEEHPSDVAIVLVADGAHGLVPADVLVHLEGCAACAVRVSEAVELSLRADSAVRAALPRVVAHPFPTRLFLAAVAMAVVGMLPSASAAARAALEAPSVLPMAAEALLSFARAVPAPLVAAAAVTAAVVLAVFGALVARQGQRQLTA